jgi:hypothetical protein
VKELTNPTNLSARGGGGSGEDTAIYSFMQAYYQGERALPPVDKNVTSPVQAMMMMSSPIVRSRIGPEGNTRVAKLLKSGKSDEAIIEELFLSSVTRRPTAAEIEVAKRLMDKDRGRGAETVQWSLLNSGEFLLNH